jgi:hypothetical protein
MAMILSPGRVRRLRRLRVRLRAHLPSPTSEQMAAWVAKRWHGSTDEATDLLAQVPEEG